MRNAAAALCMALIVLDTSSAAAQETYRVAPSLVSDPKAVFATVESPNIVPARARIGGTVAELTIKEGDRVERGQILAIVGDEKLVLQMKSLDAQIAGLEAQLQQAQTEYSRAEGLFERNIVPRARLDEIRTTVNVATNALRSRIAERSVIQQQLTEGAVLAPTAGRILKVPQTSGAVVLPGETIVTVAERNFVLRLRVPERHARFLKAGDSIRIDGAELGETGQRFGTIRLVYPQIENGQVIADATVEGLGDYFVKERLRVWISGGDRTAFIIPAAFILTRFGIDYVRVRQEEKRTVDVPVQRGRELPRPEMPDGIEILSGLQTGDNLVRP